MRTGLFSKYASQKSKQTWLIFFASSSSSSADVAPLVGPQEDSDVAMGAADLVKVSFEPRF